MGLGGSSSTSHTANPTNVFSPVAFGGGNIVAGDVGTGGVTTSGGSEAGGGSFDFKLDMPMPIPAMQLQNLKFKPKDVLHVASPITNFIPMQQQLQNLGFLNDLGQGMESAAKYGSQAYKIGKTVAPYAGEAMQYAAPETYEKYAVPATNDFMMAKEMGKSMGGWNEVGKIGRELDGNNAALAMQLQNLGFLNDLGHGMESAAKYGSQAYKIGKTVAPYAGEAMQYAAPETYEKYAVPATEDFMKAKDIGKSMGGWNEVGKIGRELDGNTAAPVAIILL